MDRQVQALRHTPSQGIPRSCRPWNKVPFLLPSGYDIHSAMENPPIFNS